MCYRGIVCVPRSVVDSRRAPKCTTATFAAVSERPTHEYRPRATANRRYRGTIYLSLLRAGGPLRFSRFFGDGFRFGVHRRWLPAAVVHLPHVDSVGVVEARRRLLGVSLDVRPVTVGSRVGPPMSTVRMARSPSDRRCPAQRPSSWQTMKPYKTHGGMARFNAVIICLLLVFQGK